MRLFEILDVLNQQDDINKTSNVGVCPDMVSVDKKGNNGFVKMGIPGDVAQNIVLNPDKKSLILLIIDREAYNEIKDGELKTPLQQLEACRQIQCSPGNFDANEYMLGMANGLILAESIMKNQEPEYLKMPEND